MQVGINMMYSLFSLARLVCIVDSYMLQIAELVHTSFAVCFP